MYHLRKIKSLMLALLVGMAAQSQIQNGKVYNFVNCADEFSGQSLVRKNASSNVLTVRTTDEISYDQLWYVAGNSASGFTVRNLEDGRYLRSSNNSTAASGAWTLVAEENLDDNCYFDFIQVGDNYTLRAKNTTDSYHCLHQNAWWGVICWQDEADASQWTTNVVNISNEELNANWKYLAALESEETYQSALEQLFTDNSCSELKSSYKSYTKSQMQSNQYYQQLPTTLQNMILKVLFGNWEETNYDTSKKPWESAYAKKYRVQLYEPYNEPEAAASALGINAHTNLNNPTGIFSAGREAIYVMVGGEIEEGASLYLASYTGNGKLGGYADGIELHKGLNVIPSSEAGNNYCINYVVHTFDTSDGKRGNDAKARKLSDYSALKIHIEGGSINGYWNKVGDDLYTADTDATWNYIEERATQTTVTVLGEYITLQFPLNEAIDNKGESNKGLSYYLDQVSVENVIEEWDDIMVWERLLLGVLDEETTKAEAQKSPYSDKEYVFDYTGGDTDDYESGYGDYYNVHGLSYGVGQNYMYGSWDHCGYHYNTMQSIIVDILENAGSHWGPGHEIGHQHQSLLTVNGLTEVTNNLFSNVVLWYFGKTTSRVNGTEGALSNVLAAYNTEGSDFFTNNIWAQTHMYYKLFLYYHVLGYNTKFYPKLFEMLRHDPMSGGYEQDGAECLLHFYKKCCEAAGEDLTEFFRAYGFLSVMTDRFVGDYSNSVYNMTQEQIDQAVADVKAMAAEKGWKENIAVLFINDATGETTKSYKGGNLAVYGETTICSEMGGYVSFKESIANTSDLTYTISGKNVTVSGRGGVGYAIYNAKGELIAFSDKQTFAISDECAEALMWGEATMKVVNADNTDVTVEVVDEQAAKYALLGGLIEEVNTNMLQYVDESNKTVGYYISEELDELEQVLEEAQEVYDNQETDSYTAMYTKLRQAYSEVMHNDYNRVPMIPGVYRLKNRNHSNRWMSVNDSKAALGEESNESSTKQQWAFESAGEEGLYYIKNVHTQLYLGSLVKDDQISADAEKADAKGYRLTSKGIGLWLVTCQDNNRMSLNWNGNSGKVLGWDGEGEAATQWTITAVSVNEDAKKLQELSALVKKTKELINEMAVVTPIQKQPLQITSASSPFYLSTNACHNTLNGASDGQGLLGLLDEDAATYFHSDYNGHNVGTHYLQVDCGSAKDLSEYIFYYTTRANGNNCPTTIEVWGSTDGTNFNDKLYTFIGLPTDGKQTWESPMLTAVKGYRSLRFMVTKAEGDNKFFVLSRFGFAKCEATVQSMGDAYTAKGLTDDQLIVAYTDIHSASDKIKVGSATSTELSDLYDNLSTKYNALLTIYENAANAAFITKKTELQTWITTLNGFFGENQCGTVNPVAATTFTLSTTNNNTDYYLTGGPGAPSEGTIANLLDNKVSSYYVSNWSTQNEDHYLQVRLPEGKALSEFTFTFTSRDGGKAPTPTIIVVSGSNDGSTFTPIKTFTKEANGFPEAADTDNKEAGKAVKWSSPAIAPSESYKSLRFTVTKSERSNGGEADSNGHYHYSISEFGLGTPSSYNVTLGTKAGGVTEDLLLETYNIVAAAEATHTMATTEEQLQKAIDKLKALKIALEDAQKTVVRYSVVVKGGNGNGGIMYNNVEHKNGAQLDAPSSLTADVLTPISLGQGYTEGTVIVDGTTITVTYQKKYTVQITGGEYKGRVVYNGTEYEHGVEIVVPSAIEGVTAKDVTGYESTIEVNHETGAITVTYTLDTTVLVAQIESLNKIIAECGVVKFGKYPTETAVVSLTEANLSTNAQEASEGSIANLLKDDNTYFHSSWTASVGETHYLQVDLGEGKTLQEFVFGYTTRSVGPHPYIIVVSGSNSPEGTFEDIKVFNSGLPNSSASWEAPAPIKAAQPYRYLRFTVTKSSDLRSYGEYSFAMSKFGLKTINYSENEDYYVESLNLNGSVTEEQLLAAYRTVVEAGNLDNDNTTKSELDSMIETLKTLGSGLESARDNNPLPVELTTDVQHPVLYTFKSRRGENKALQYDPAENHMFSIANASEGNVKQMFYFTMGDTRTQVFVHPFVAGEQVLAASDLLDGKEKLFAAEVNSTEAMPMQWTFEKDGEWYSLNGVEAPYFSNYGGGSNKMGFYGSKDDGSCFQFYDVDETTIEGSAAYNSLRVYYDEATKVAGSNIQGRDAVGYYPTTEANAYNQAYLVAEAALIKEGATYAEYLEAYKAFFAANEALELNMPKEGVYYTIVSACTGDRGGQLMYALGDNTMKFGSDKTSSDGSWIRPEALWTFTSEGYLKNLQTDCFVCTSSYWGEHHTLAEEGAKVISVESLSLDGQVLLTPQGAHPLHAQSNGSWIVGWPSEANDASAWRIVEVEDMSLVNFALTISKYRHAGLYLNYSVEIPESVKVYIAHTPNGTAGEIIADELDGTIIPARTAVIVKGDAGTYNFKYTTGTATDDVSANLLGGSAYLKYQQVAQEGNRCCVFGQKNDEVGLYKNWIQYVDANGSTTITEGEGEDKVVVADYAKTDNGNYFRISANKIYYEYEPASVANTSAFRFRFNNKAEGTTAIDELILGDDVVIYNLYGLRIVEIVEPGIYIINGKKTYVSEKMILYND